MKIEHRRTYSFTREELEQAMLIAAGLPADVKLEFFSADSEHTASPAVRMTVIFSEEPV